MTHTHTEETIICSFLGPVWMKYLPQARECTDGLSKSVLSSSEERRQEGME